MSDFSSDLYFDVHWGVVNIRGEQIISPLYGYLRLKDGYILAGNNEDYWGHVYHGLYNLYNKSGDLLIGGFRIFEYDEIHGYFIFSFGGNWETHNYLPIEEDGWNNSYDPYSYDDWYYVFNEEHVVWLVLDKEFKTVLADKSGNHLQIQVGFIGKVEINEDNGRKTVSNIPSEFLIKNYSEVIKLTSKSIIN